ncbi:MULTISPECIES: class IIb bacteriocin, lactobin A/cerein 7B family [unclassified Nostoc]|uniref:class IIb bacteriocin, lactobin A/cerein 7B family n=1 Tax=unclassified Nostoc TaxID=2593658 RepID=UPI002AD39E90|nr:MULTISPECIES: class IIb bacteriocin, lactobin A/cerein 7B family [unclassified Nostoc]MDZ8126263.1 class IIb bacteriocin, lactobin A/cerein 7B family [Nostoc sp. CmiVER01]MDZ8227299.1 class IIb bacteriocin, lactobin A/cerein 7B family [Nostoc sp. ChiVER01]
MATIAISNLRTPGAELFIDSESYLQELTDTELDATKGGISPLVVLSIVAIVAIASK